MIYPCSPSLSSDSPRHNCSWIPFALASVANILIVPCRDVRRQKATGVMLYFLIWICARPCVSCFSKSGQGSRRERTRMSLAIRSWAIAHSLIESIA